ncbi:hypothetical protein LCGC14_2409880, partial [marine sediment metagenome]
KKEPTSDAVEILHRLYGKSLWRRWGLWLARIKLKKEKETYAEGFHDGYKFGYAEGNNDGRYGLKIVWSLPYLK